jgi:hypothetical protein
MSLRCRSGRRGRPLFATRSQPPNARPKPSKKSWTVSTRHSLRTLDRHRHVRRREELTLARIDHHSGQLEELDVEGILAFAERILPRAADLWVQASLEQRQRFQQLFFPNGIAFDGNRLVRTGATAPAFNYLREIRTEHEGLVDQILTSWNPLISWLRQIDGLPTAA